MRDKASATQDELRERIGLLVDQGGPKEQPTVFVSYRRQAEGLALGLVHELKDSPHARKWSFFIDQLTIPPGAEWERYISDHLTSSWVMLLVISPGWNEGARLDDPGNFVRREIELAREHTVPVIPVLLDGAVLPAASELPESLRWLSAVPALETFNQQLRRVMIANLAVWLSEIKRAVDDAGDEVAKAEKAVGKLAEALVEARAGQGKSEAQASDAAARRAALDTRIADAEHKLADERAKITPPREPGRVRVYIDSARETEAEAKAISLKVSETLGAGVTVQSGLEGAAVRDRAAAEAQVARVDVVLALIGPEWPASALESDAGTAALEVALTRGLPIFPLLIRRVREPEAGGLPASLKPLFAHHFLTLRHEFWEPATDKLVKELDQFDKMLAQRERSVRAEQAAVERLRREADKVSDELSRAQAEGRSAADRISSLERELARGRDEASRLKGRPADRNEAYLKGPPKVSAGAG
ncbi:MAG TPA: TIR domain-containing protein [Solirubrobacteraceae bacterium]|nr:TIR domain-containing protein [Solirubrobacteraceae bacterium]